MTRKLFFALGAVTVLALIVGLIVAVRGSASGARPPAPASPAVPVERPTTEVPARPPVAAPSQTVTAPTPSGDTAAPPQRQPGVPVIHDHRKDPPSGIPSPFLPETVAKIRQALTPALDSCASSAPAGATAKFSLQVAARSTAGRVSVAQPELSGAEAMGEAYAACVRNAVSAIQADAASGQEDAAESILFPLHVP